MSALPTAIEAAMRREIRPTDPVRTTDNSSTYGWNNTLIEAATQTDARSALNLVDYDIHRTISVIGRRTLMSLGRTMFWRMPALQAQILEQAHLAADPFTPRFGGKNKDWGDAALEWLNAYHRTIDLAGWPYDFDSYVLSLIVAPLVDGDEGTVLTQDKDGNPKIQVIPSHRIGSRYQTGGSAHIKLQDRMMIVDDVLVDSNMPPAASPIEWDAPIIDGVIVDGQSRPIAYRLFDDPAVSGSYRDVSASNMFLSFAPVITGQVRGFSGLASSIFDWQDVREFRRFEMLAQKAFSTRTIIEENESGEADTTQQLLSSPAQFDATTGQKTALDTQTINGGTYTYFKAGTNSKLSAFDWSRPSQNAQAFQDTLVRDAFRGTEWDAFFSLDPKSVGGAPMRVIVDKINRVLRKRRRLASKCCLRVDTYGLSKAMARGEIPFDPEWYKWTYQGPTDLTADRRYDAQTDQMEWEMGWITMEDIETRRGGIDWRVKRQQSENEVDDLYTRADRLAKKWGIPIQEAANRISNLESAKPQPPMPSKVNAAGDPLEP